MGTDGDVVSIKNDLFLMKSFRLQVVYEFKRKMASGEGGLDADDVEEGFGAGKP